MPCHGVHVICLVNSTSWWSRVQKYDEEYCWGFWQWLGWQGYATWRSSTKHLCWIISQVGCLLYSINCHQMRWGRRWGKQTKNRASMWCEFCTTLSTTERDSLTRPFVCVKWKVGGGRKGAKEAHAPILFRSNKKKFILNKHNQGLW